MLTSHGNTDGGVRLRKKALALATEIGDFDTQCSATKSLGQAFHVLGDLEMALFFFNKRISIAEQTNHRELLPACHAGVGMILAKQANSNPALVPEATRAFMRSLECIDQLQGMVGPAERLSSLHMHGSMSVNCSCISLKMIKPWTRCLWEMLTVVCSSTSARQTETRPSTPQNSC
eukprot:m.70803 g.70803  ORF g.70803 m.70803 type:complete len:176 (+) comp14098_c0_seq1:770-1297(+)